MNSSAVLNLAVLWLESEKVDQTNFPKGKHMNIRRGFLALAAMILGVGFFGASQAQAQVSTVPITRGGITCNKVIGGTYPEDGHMFRCSSVASYNNELQARPKNVMNRVLAT